MDRGGAKSQINPTPISREDFHKLLNAGGDKWRAWLLVGLNCCMHLLTGLLTATQDGKRLKGYTSGPTGRHVRYYVHPIAQKDPVLAGFPNVLIRADALEAAVLSTLSETLLAMPTLRAEIEAAVAAIRVQRQSPNADETATLKQRKAAISKKVAAILDLIDEAEPEARAKIAELKREQRRIDERLNMATDSASESILSEVRIKNPALDAREKSHEVAF